MSAQTHIPEREVGYGRAERRREGMEEGGLEWEEGVGEREGGREGGREEEGQEGM